MAEKRGQEMDKLVKQWPLARRRIHGLAIIVGWRGALRHGDMGFPSKALYHYHCSYNYLFPALDAQCGDIHLQPALLFLMATRSATRRGLSILFYGYSQ